MNTKTMVKIVATLALVAALDASALETTQEDSTEKPNPAIRPHPPTLGDLAHWDQGLSEMSYYRATESIYGQEQTYVRVHLVNRQWLDRKAGVKCDADAPNAIPIFKINVAEEIPTPNYNYRYLTTTFLDRYGLAPLKMVTSSQEWCGATFKHLRWLENTLSVKSFSYFGGEGDQTWQIDGRPFPYEGLIVLARDVALSGKPRSLSVLLPIRSTHAVTPSAKDATLSLGASETITTPFGEFETILVELDWDGPITRFHVESTAPYRLIRFAMGTVSGELQGQENRAYWDRTWESRYHKFHHAP